MLQKANREGKELIQFIIENEQEKLEFTDELENIIERAASATLDVLECDVDCEVSVLITDNDGIREINKEYRQKDVPTDVLSFPILEFDDDGVMIEESGDYDGDLLLLGDIVISLEKAAEQAEEYGHSLLREIGFLTAHSMLHLCGFDHMEEPYASMMRDKEKLVMEKVGLKR